MHYPSMLYRFWKEGSSITNGRMATRPPHYLYNFILEDFSQELFLFFVFSYLLLVLCFLALCREPFCNLDKFLLFSGDIWTFTIYVTVTILFVSFCDWILEILVDHSIFHVGVKDKKYLL
jgi:hypothetical protein